MKIFCLYGTEIGKQNRYIASSWVNLLAKVWGHTEQDSDYIKVKHSTKKKRGKGDG